MMAGAQVDSQDTPPAGGPLHLLPPTNTDTDTDNVNKSTPQEPIASVQSQSQAQQQQQQQQPAIPARRGLFGGMFAARSTQNNKTKAQELDEARRKQEEFIKKQLKALELDVDELEREKKRQEELVQQATLEKERRERELEENRLLQEEEENERRKNELQEKRQQQELGRKRRRDEREQKRKQAQLEKQQQQQQQQQDEQEEKKRREEELERQRKEQEELARNIVQEDDSPSYQEQRPQAEFTADSQSPSNQKTTLRVGRKFPIIRAATHSPSRSKSRSRSRSHSPKRDQDRQHVSHSVENQIQRTSPKQPQDIPQQVGFANDAKAIQTPIIGQQESKSNDDDDDDDTTKLQPTTTTKLARIKSGEILLQTEESEIPQPPKLKAAKSKNVMDLTAHLESEKQKRDRHQMNRHGDDVSLGTMELSSSGNMSKSSLEKKQNKNNSNRRRGKRPPRLVVRSSNNDSNDGDSMVKEERISKAERPWESASTKLLLTSANETNSKNGGKTETPADQEKERDFFSQSTANVFEKSAFNFQYNPGKEGEDEDVSEASNIMDIADSSTFQNSMDHIKAELEPVPSMDPEDVLAQNLDESQLFEGMGSKVSEKIQEQEGGLFEEAWTKADVDKSFVAELKALKALKAEKDSMKKESSSKEREGSSKRLILFENDKHGSKKKKKDRKKKKSKKGKNGKDILSREFKQAMEAVFASDNEEEYTATFSKGVVDELPKDIRRRNRSRSRTKSESSQSAVSVSSEDFESDILRRIRERSLHARKDQAREDQSVYSRRSHNSRQTSRSHMSETRSRSSARTRSTHRSRSSAGSGSKSPRRRHLPSDRSTRSSGTKKSSASRSSKRSAVTSRSVKSAKKSSGSPGSKSLQGWSQLSKRSGRTTETETETAESSTPSRSRSADVSRQSRSHSQSHSRSSKASTAGRSKSVASSLASRRSRRPSAGRRPASGAGTVASPRRQNSSDASTVASRRRKPSSSGSVKSARTWHVGASQVDPSEFYAREMERLKNKTFSAGGLMKEMEDLRKRREGSHKKTKSSQIPKIPLKHSSTPSSKAPLPTTNREVPQSEPAFRTGFQTSLMASNTAQALLGGDGVRSSLFTDAFKMSGVESDNINEIAAERLSGRFSADLSDAILAGGSRLPNLVPSSMGVLGMDVNDCGEKGKQKGLVNRSRNFLSRRLKTKEAKKQNDDSFFAGFDDDTNEISEGLLG